MLTEAKIEIEILGLKIIWYVEIYVYRNDICKLKKKPQGGKKKQQGGRNNPGVSNRLYQQCHRSLHTPIKKLKVFLLISFNIQ